MARTQDYAAGALGGAAQGAAAGSVFGPWGTVIGGVGGGILGAFGAGESADAQNAARDQYNQAVGGLQSAQMGPESAVPVYDYEYVTPDMLYQDPAAAYAYADPEAVNAQYSALDQMQQWGNGQLTQADMAGMQLGQMSNAQQERGSREAYMNSLNQRGMGGSGAEIAGVMSGMQNTTNANAMQALSMQVAAQDRALRATESAANMASGLRGSSYGEARDRASVWDQFNQANTDYRRGVQGANVDRTNNQANAIVAGNQTMYNQAKDVASMQTGVPTDSSNPWATAIGGITNAATIASNFVDEDGNPTATASGGGKKG